MDLNVVVVVLVIENCYTYCERIVSDSRRHVVNAFVSNQAIRQSGCINCVRVYKSTWLCASLTATSNWIRCVIKTDFYLA